jgi:hypothetical protein
MNGWDLASRACARTSIGFLDETGTTTKMPRLRGRARVGARLKAKAPFGHWKTQIPAFAGTGFSSPACAVTA